MNGNYDDNAMLTIMMMMMVLMMTIMKMMTLPINHGDTHNETKMYSQVEIFL